MGASCQTPTAENIFLPPNGITTPTQLCCTHKISAKNGKATSLTTLFLILSFILSSGPYSSPAPVLDSHKCSLFIFYPRSPWKSDILPASYLGNKWYIPFSPRNLPQIISPMKGSSSMHVNHCKWLGALGRQGDTKPSF